LSLCASFFHPAFGDNQRSMIWTILGLSVGILALFCIATAEFLVGTPIFEPFRAHIAIALGVSGGVAWLVGRFITSRKAGDAPRGFLLADLRYWGPMFVVMALITIFIRPLRFTEPAKPAAPRKPEVAKVVPVQKPQPVVQTAKAAPHVFPKLKIGGIIFGRNSAPVVLLNGRSYVAGDQIGEVTVKAIERNGVVLEMSGEAKFLAVY
jgi:hypothetical protein